MKESWKIGPKWNLECVEHCKNENRKYESMDLKISLVQLGNSRESRWQWLVFIATNI